MKLPVKLDHTFHKHGGRIVEITSMGHELDKPQDGYSRDFWFYVGTVIWDGTTLEKKCRIYPHDLCYDSDNEKVGWQEINGISELLMQYLREHGEWCDRGSKHQGWYANRKVSRAA